ncbi:unnamed protein product [Trifolium pratense]|uniref:Uncharacterized protein n=1 Tax=Trifolium pratense TaxID=57577 RepID=A0ACB0M4B3_TRIPR|nr:unnamed protein product [Trifolium pratense]
MHLSVLVLCLVTITSHRVDGSHTKVNEDLEVERQLKLINKSPIKSIHTKFGYIVDCVDINKQPAFDHPFLKNHKLQRRPNFYIKKDKTSVKNSTTNPTFGFDEVECPTGTVPIRRTTKDDLIRAEFLRNDNILVATKAHHADVSLKVPGERYYAVKGTTSIYNPKISIAQASSSHIYIQSGDGTNNIIVGWHVFPHIYGDDKTHLFVAWTSDNFKKTGCYNVQCRGFVQIESHYHVGGVIPNISAYGGPVFDMPIEIFLENNRWWVAINNYSVGYFPATLFTNLKGADEVGWGGSTIAIGVPNPPMASGYFPDGNLYHAGYFINIGYRNAPRSAYIGPAKFSIHENSDAPNCYRVKYYEHSRFGHALEFGGPGGNCNV